MVICDLTRPSVFYKITEQVEYSIDGVFKNTFLFVSTTEQNIYNHASL